MENMGKDEYKESMNVKSWFPPPRFGKKKAFTHTDKKRGGEPNQPTLIFFLHYSEQTYFLYASAASLQAMVGLSTVHVHNHLLYLIFEARMLTTISPARKGSPVNSNSVTETLAHSGLL